MLDGAAPGQRSAARPARLGSRCTVPYRSCRPRQRPLLLSRRTGRGRGRDWRSAVDHVLHARPGLRHGMGGGGPRKRRWSRGAGGGDGASLERRRAFKAPWLGLKAALCFAFEENRRRLAGGKENPPEQTERAREGWERRNALSFTDESTRSVTVRYGNPPLKSTVADRRI